MDDRVSQEESDAFFKKLDDFIAAYSALSVDDDDEEESSLDTSRSSRASRSSKKEDPKEDPKEEAKDPKEEPKESSATSFTHFSRGTSERKTIEGRQSRSSMVPKRRSISLCPKPVSDPRTGCTYMLVKGHMPSWKGMCKHCGEYINMDSHMFFMKCATGKPEDEMFFTKVLGTDQFPSAGVRNPRDSTPVPWGKSGDRTPKASDAKSPGPSAETGGAEGTESPSTSKDEAAAEGGDEAVPKPAGEEPCDEASGETEGAGQTPTRSSDVVELLYDRATGAVTVRDGLREINVRGPRKKDEGN